jgi:hypothetical protein
MVANLSEKLIIASDQNTSGGPSEEGKGAGENARAGAFR